MTLLENLMVVGKGKERRMMERAADLLRLSDWRRKKTIMPLTSRSASKSSSPRQVLMLDPSSFFLTNLRQGSTPRSRMS